MQTLSVITALICRVSNRLAFRPCRTGRILPSLSIKIISLYKEKDQARISFADRTHVQTVSFLSRCQTSMWFPRYKDPAYDRLGFWNILHTRHLPISKILIINIDCLPLILIIRHYFLGIISLSCSCAVIDETGSILCLFQA